MKPRTDVPALVVGLLAVTIAGLGLWGAIGVINWALVWLTAPLLLVAFGLIGLFASRPR